MREKNLNRTKLAEEFKVSKGYITQIFNGDFDHKLSKLIELSLASNKAPLIHFVDLNDFVKHDGEDKKYHLIPMINQKTMRYTKPFSQQAAAGIITKSSTPSMNKLFSTSTSIQAELR